MLPPCNYPTTTITIGSRSFFEITPTQGHSSRENILDAVELLEEMKQTGRNHLITLAAVDRWNGLVLAVDPQINHHPMGWHFQALLAGYQGSGSLDSADVLARSGFGNRDEIYEQIKKGGDRAAYYFSK